MTRVKMCGLMNEIDINLCVQAGVHTLGFVVDYPVSVPWNLTTDEASKLVQSTPPFVSTCVVTGGTVEKVLDVAEKVRPNIVQLHYEETLDEVIEIARHMRMQGIKTIKALRIDASGKCRFEIDDPAMAARELSSAGISAILVDSYTEAMPGGTGVRVDVETFEKVQEASALPVILAGGLNPENIHSLVTRLRPFAVDVLTGVEMKPGKKDVNKVGQFMKNIHLSLA